MCTWVQCLWRPEDGIRYSGTGVLGSCELPNMVLGTDSGLLPVQCVLLADPSLQVLGSFSYFSTGHCFYVALAYRASLSFMLSFMMADSLFDQNPSRLPPVYLLLKCRVGIRFCGISLIGMTSHWLSPLIYDPSSTISQQLPMSLLFSSNSPLCWFGQNLIYQIVLTPAPASWW